MIEKETLRAGLLLVSMMAAGLGLPSPAHGQPATDIHLARIDLIQPVPRVGHLVNVSNRAGYDNQPMFDTRGESLYFTAIDSSAQADIYRFDITPQAMHHLTRTRESEYSPTITPDARSLSVVRVDLDGEQRLWRVGLDGTPGEPLLDLTRIGYHTWVDSDLVGLFLVGSPGGDSAPESPHLLAFANLRTGRVDTVLTSPGRCLRALPGIGVVTTCEMSPQEATSAGIR